MRIVKNNHRGEKVWEYPGEVISKSKTGYFLRAIFNRDDLPFNGVLFRQGDEFLEFYPAGKWFNIYQIHDRDSKEIKAWYCNITRPFRVKDETLEYDDLALDLMVYPDGSAKVLDEDEFESHNLSEEDRRMAKEGLLELKNLFSGSGGFELSEFVKRR